jgi:hypothetical protein
MTVHGDPQGQDGADAQPARLLGQLNDKAKAARADDEKSLRALADEVFNTADLNSAPAGMLDAVKERLVRAEIGYRNGRDEGIPEINVVKVVNGFAREFKAPEYAKTSKFEVRQLRVRTLLLLPNFIADGRRPAKVGDSIAERMSPMEATFITVLLLKQKLSNPEYQVTHAERVSKWAEKHGGRKNETAKQSKAKDADDSSARREEMERVIARRTSEISAFALLNIPSNALNVLGVKE